MDSSIEEAMRTQELLHAWAEAKDKWEVEGKRIGALERELRRRTAIAWVGAVSTDEDGREGRTPWPVSVEVPENRCRLLGNKLELACGRSFNDDSITLVIGGPEKRNSFSDLSGTVIYRAFREQADAEQWVKDIVNGEKRP